jgi:hypothetical protein
MPSWPTVSLAKTLGVLSFTPLTMLQACAQTVDFKVGHHFGEGQAYRSIGESRNKDFSKYSEGKTL